MKKATYVIPTVVAVLVLWCAAAPPGARAARDKIINSFATPTGAPAGLTFGDGILYLGDFFSMRIYRMNPDTGSVISSFVPSPKPAGSFMYGLAYASGYLWADTGRQTRLFKIAPSSGSVVASYTVGGITSCDGIAADASYVYVANNNVNAVYIYKYSPTGGSIVASWPGAKYPAGLNIITHVPTSKQVLMNLGNVDGWVYISDLNGVRHEGEQFKIDAPCPEGYFTGDLATRDKTHIFYACGYLKTVFEHEIDWGGQEEYAVAPTSFGRVKALFR
jgi:outer membrane protein assembly factor BamB